MTGVQTCALPISIERHVPLVEEIEDRWMSAEGQASPTWTGHREISTAMLGVSLVPEAFVQCGSGPRRSVAVTVPAGNGRNSLGR